MNTINANSTVAGVNNPYRRTEDASAASVASRFDTEDTVELSFARGGDGDSGEPGPIVYQPIEEPPPFGNDG